MFDRDSLETLFSAIETADKAACDASDIEAILLMQSDKKEFLLRGRMIAIERREGFTPVQTAAIWELLGLKRGFPVAE